jgi:hypothetical protein
VARARESNAKMRFAYARARHCISFHPAKIRVRDASPNDLKTHRTKIMTITWNHGYLILPGHSDGDTTYGMTSCIVLHRIGALPGKFVAVEMMALIISDLHVSLRVDERL